MRHPGSTTTRSTPTHPQTTTSRRRDGHPRPTNTPAPVAQPRPLLPGLDLNVTEQQRAQLWAMTRDQRVEAMYQGRLTLGQLTVWSGARQDEVPLIGGELAYLAMRDANWCEPSQSKVRS